MKLRISDDFSLPADAVTSTIVVYGGKGMGKTNLASVLVEEFAAAGLRFAVIDPMGVWWGLRHGLNGKGAGIKALILGGIHGDMPIDPSSGAVVADLVVDEDDSVIIDISRRPDGSMWSIAERIRFVTDYAKRLYQRQGEKRRPIHQVIDEAARFVPQVVRSGDLDVAKCMGAIAVIVEEGRNVGIGVTLVTQRSARLNKDVAELADCMIAFRIIGPNSMRAVLDWLGEHVEKARLKELGQKLRSLPRGSALVISPGWLEFEGIAAMRKRKTFDSSATPKVGKQLRVSGTGAKPTDLTKYRARMAEVIEHQKANDPTELKKQVAALKKELANVGKGFDRAEANEKELHAESYELRSRVAQLEAQLAAARRAKQATVEVIKPAELRRLEELVKKIDKLILRITGTNADLELHLSGLRAEAGKLKEVATRVTEFHAKRGKADPGPIIDEVLALADTTAVPASLPAEKTRRHAAATPPTSKVNGTAAPRVNGASATIGGGLRRMLVALAQRPQGLTNRQIGIRAGLSSKSGTFSTYLGRARSEGWIEDRGDVRCITEAGLAALGHYDPLPTGPELARHWLGELGNSGAARILRVLVEAYPESLDDATIGDRAGLSPKSGTYSTYCGKLRGLELIEGARGAKRASEELFS